MLTDKQIARVRRAARSRRTDKLAQAYGATGQAARAAHRAYTEGINYVLDLLTKARRSP